MRFNRLVSGLNSGGKSIIMDFCFRVSGFMTVNCEYVNTTKLGSQIRFRIYFIGGRY